MKRIGLILMAVIFGSVTIFSQNLKSKKSTSTESKLIVTQVHSPGLENNILNDSPDRNVTLYLPPGYEDYPKIHYPVLYLLHGGLSDNNFWFGGGYLDIDMKKILDTLINKNIIIPMIAVAPDAKNKYGGSWYTNSTVTGNWEDFIVHDLVQHVDSNYRTLPQAESRGIAGHSMGGYGTIKLPMKHPDIFGVAYSLSGGFLIFEDIRGTMKEDIIKAVQSDSFSYSLPLEVQVIYQMAVAFAPNLSTPSYSEFPLTENGELIDSVWQKWLEHEPYSMIYTYKDSLLKLRAIQFDCGTSDEYFYDGNVGLSQALSENGIEHVFQEYNGDHYNKVTERIESKVLPFFSATLSKNMLGDTVVIPDTAFLYALIEEGVDTNRDSLISYSEAESITSLDVTHKDISDMTGIGAFVNLGTLLCAENPLQSLDLSNNTALTWLVCHENQLTSLDVSALAAITVLLCNNNELSILDVSHNIFLGFLSCGNNQLTSLDISNNTALGTHMLTYKLLVLDIRAELLLKNMPTLYEVCVSESFNMMTVIAMMIQFILTQRAAQMFISQQSAAEVELT